MNEDVIKWCSRGETNIQYVEGIEKGEEQGTLDSGEQEKLTLTQV